MSWELFVIKGDRALVRGFVHGFVWGAGDPQGVHCEAELPLEKESLATWLQLGPHQRLLVKSQLAERLAAALGETHEELKVQLQERLPVRELAFHVEARVFSPELAAALQEKLFAHLPEGVEVRDKNESQSQDTAARGAELYAPVHHFDYRVSCTFAGTVEGILDLHRRLSGTDFVKVSPLRVR
ncbi:MAG: hypothetical protein NZ869_03050 [Thermoanaerobaculum sp.]|nr:hypothetical protein [Thermoanaerobaculum sp.]MDW7967249.1 hypothetical protein [Thermoanaerobaculum sp.]